MSTLQPYASNAFVAAALVGGVDYFLDKNLKKALIVGAVTGLLLYIANGSQISTTVG